MTLTNNSPSTNKINEVQAFDQQFICINAS